MTDKEKDIPGEADPSSGSIQLMIATRKTGRLLTISLTAPQTSDVCEQPSSSGHASILRGCPFSFSGPDRLSNISFV